MSPPFVAGLVVEGRRCVVIGGDREAAEKSGRLADAGGVVRVIAPALDPAFDALRARVPSIEWLARADTDADVRDAFLVIYTIADANRARQLFALATSRGPAATPFLLCCIDQPAYCTLTNVAVVRRGLLQIAIATSGAAPGLASRIRAAMESQLGEDLTAFVDGLGRLRASLAPGERRESMKKALEGFAWTVSYELPDGSHGAPPGAAGPEHTLR